MKRSYVLCVVSLALLLGGCGNKQDNTAYIGADKAQQLALDACGMTAAGVSSITAELTARNGQDCYQVDITVAGQSYQYSIDARTGAIVATGFCAAPEGSPANDVNTNQAAPDQTAPDQTAPVQAAPAQTTPAPAAPVPTPAAGVSTHHPEEHHPDEHHTGQAAAPSVSTTTAITADEAKELALAKVPGASASDIREFEVDYDDGRTEYEGKIIYSGTEYEFEIDAGSGQFLSWEEEPASWW